MLNGEIQYYTITTSDGGDVNTTETSFTLEMLEPFTQYRFEVVAATIAGPGMAALTNARTEEDGTYNHVNHYKALKEYSLDVQYPNQG